MRLTVPPDGVLPEITLDAAITTGGGNITVDAGEQGTLLVRGDVDASNTSSGAHGGTIQLLGNHVGLFDEATVDASGDGAGGTILIGGDQQGLNPDVRNASAVFLGENTQVRADALTEGDGGRVIVFAEDSARIHGEISATGGAISGDGGFIETSGKRGFSITRTPDASAPNGAGGTWLIDPFTVSVVTGMGQTNIDPPSSPGDPFDPNATGAQLGSDIIRGGLSNGDVIISTGAEGSANPGNEDGDILWSANMDMNGFGVPNGRLTLNAHNDIVITGSIYDSDLTVDESVRGLTLNADYGTTDTPSDNNGRVIIEAEVSTSPGDVMITIAGAGPGEGFLDVSGTDFEVRSSGDYGGIVDIMAESSISVNLHTNAVTGQMGDVTIEGGNSTYGYTNYVRLQTDTFSVDATNMVVQGGSTGNGNNALVSANTIDINLAGNLEIAGGAAGNNNNAYLQGGYVGITANDIMVRGTNYGRAQIYADDSGSNISGLSMHVIAPTVFDGSAIVSLGDNGVLTVDELTLNNGELNSDLDGPAGNSIITVNEVFNWQGGAIYGSGILNTNGVGEISGPGNAYLGDRTWNQNADYRLDRW